LFLILKKFLNKLKMHIYRSQSALNIPFGPGITRTYSKPSFATYMCR